MCMCGGVVEAGILIVILRKLWTWVTREAKR